MVRHKTGSLLGTACRVGSLLAGEDQTAQQATWQFGEVLGIAFQLQDDFLGVWGEANQLGKAPNDLAERKRGLPLVLAMQGDPRIGILLAGSPEDTETTDEICKLLENLGIQKRTESVAEGAANEALVALEELPISLEPTVMFRGLVELVISRAA